jgi:hypothetical protein
MMAGDPSPKHRAGRRANSAKRSIVGSTMAGAVLGATVAGALTGGLGAGTINRLECAINRLLSRVDSAQVLLID